MKVLAINGSPRGKTSCTSKMLTPILAGMQEEGAETECINLVEHSVHHCLGCLCCWTKTPGKCVIADDMAAFLDKIIAADILILGTPLYIFSMTGLMKNFIDRLLPLAEPWLLQDEKNPNRTVHPLRSPKKMKVFLVSPAGFPEFCHFDALVTTFKQFTDTMGIEYLGEILRPGAEVLRVENIFVRFILRSYFANLKKVGRELVLHGKVSEELQLALKKDLLPGGPAMYRKVGNRYFKKQLAKLNK